MASSQVSSAPVSCPRRDCHTTLSRTSDIQRHIRDVHDIEKWCCPYAGCKYRGSKRKDNVVTHIAQRHLEREHSIWDRNAILEPITEKSLSIRQELVQAEFASSLSSDDKSLYAMSSPPSNAPFPSCSTASTSTVPFSTSIQSTWNVQTGPGFPTLFPAQSSTSSLHSDAHAPMAHRPEYFITERSLPDVWWPDTVGTLDTGNMSCFYYKGDPVGYTTTHDAWSIKSQYSGPHFQSVSEAPESDQPHGNWNGLGDHKRL